jgi:hypothetical protein
MYVISICACSCKIVGKNFSTLNCSANTLLSQYMNGYVYVGTQAVIID